MFGKCQKLELIFSSMCLAVPGKILSISIDGDYAEVDFRGVVKKTVIALLPEAKVDEYVVVHAGMAIEILSDEDAKASLDTWDEVIEKTGIILDLS